MSQSYARDTLAEKRKTPQQEAFDGRLADLIDKAMEADHAMVSKLVDPAALIGIYEITPVVAALIYAHHNGHNRDFSLSKAHGYAEAMRRGEWKLNHQGLAFYPNGDLADGQHRTAAQVLSGTTQRYVIMPNFDKDAFDTIDVGKGRTAGDAVQLRGLTDPKIKAAIARTVIQYEAEVGTGRVPQPTVIEIEKFVNANNGALDEALSMTRAILMRVSEPVLSEAESATAALLLMRGGYVPQVVGAFLTAVQLGIADYPEAPTTDLSRQFMRARVSQRKSDVMNRKHKLALMCKGAQLFVQNKSVRSVTWKASKEPLPSPMPPLQAAAE